MSHSKGVAVFLGAFLLCLLIESRVFAYSSSRCHIRGDKIVLDFHGKVFHRRSTIRLKSMINMLCPIDVPLRYVHLDRVKLVAKSRRGLAQAQLRVGHSYTRPQRVRGFRGDFYSRRHYDRIMMENPAWSEDTRGRWQINLRGTVKVKKIVLFLDDFSEDEGDRWEDRF